MLESTGLLNARKPECLSTHGSSDRFSNGIDGARHLCDVPIHIPRMPGAEGERPWKRFKRARTDSNRPAAWGVFDHSSAEISPHTALRDDVTKSSPQWKHKPLRRRTALRGRPNAT